MDRKHITISETELQKMLQCASEQGAKKILLQLGLSDEEAGEDIRDLRSLIDGWRTVKRTAIKTATQSFVVAILSALAVGAFFKWFD